MINNALPDALDAHHDDLSWHAPVAQRPARVSWSVRLKVLAAQVAEWFRTRIVRRLRQPQASVTKRFPAAQLPPDDQPPQFEPPTPSRLLDVRRAMPSAPPPTAAAVAPRAVAAAVSQRRSLILSFPPPDFEPGADYVPLPPPQGFCRETVLIDEAAAAAGRIQLLRRMPKPVRSIGPVEAQDEPLLMLLPAPAPTAAASPTAWPQTSDVAMPPHEAHGDVAHPSPLSAAPVEPLVRQRKPATVVTLTRPAAPLPAPRRSAAVGVERPPQLASIDECWVGVGDGTDAAPLANAAEAEAPQPSEPAIASSIEPIARVAESIAELSSAEATEEGADELEWVGKPVARVAEPIAGFVPVVATGEVADRLALRGERVVEPIEELDRAPATDEVADELRLGVQPVARVAEPMEPVALSATPDIVLDDLSPVTEPIADVLESVEYVAPVAEIDDALPYLHVTAEPIARVADLAEEVTLVPTADELLCDLEPMAAEPEESISADVGLLLASGDPEPEIRFDVDVEAEVPTPSADVGIVAAADEQPIDLSADAADPSGEAQTLAFDDARVELFVAAPATDDAGPPPVEVSPSVDLLQPDETDSLVEMASSFDELPLEAPVMEFVAPVDESAEPLVGALEWLGGADLAADDGAIELDRPALPASSSERTTAATEASDDSFAAAMPGDTFEAPIEEWIEAAPPQFADPLPPAIAARLDEAFEPAPPTPTAARRPVPARRIVYVQDGAVLPVCARRVRRTMARASSHHRSAEPAFSIQAALRPSPAPPSTEAFHDDGL